MATRPSRPPAPTVTATATSTIKVKVNASKSNGGKAIDYYIIREWQNSKASGSYVRDIKVNKAGTIELSRLYPGHQYTYKVFAHNSVGNSSISSGVTKRVVSQIRVRSDGTWKRAAVWFNVNNVWHPARVWVRQNGVWKLI